MNLNRFPGRCAKCGGNVGKMQGICLKENGKWTTYHKEGECVKAEDWSKIKFDSYQQKIVDAIVDGSSHVIATARAGSGKTTVECYAFSKLHRKSPELKLLLLAFGNEDGQRMRNKLPLGVDGRTTHSFCMEVIKKAYPGIKFNKSKVQELLYSIVGPEDDKSEIRTYVFDLLEKVKADAVELNDNERMEECNDTYDLGIPEDMMDEVLVYTNKCLEVGADFESYGFDFNDALYYCAIRKLPLGKFDVVGVDESQDLNESQLILIKKFVQTGARIVVVGDDRQSLYLFRGTRSDCFDRIKNILGEDTVELTMPVSRRNSQAVVRHAQRWVEDIKALPNAPEGEIQLNYPELDLIENLRSDDMVVCRTNAPLIRFAYKMIASNKKFYMRGGVVEAGRLCWYIDFWAKKSGSETEDIAEMLSRAQSWLADRAGKMKGMKLEEHRGRIEVLSIISEHCLSITHLKREVYKLFQAPSDPTGYIVLSTIHRAKGSESERVFHISPELVPHRLAKTPEQIKVEENAIYVAITRAKFGYYECREAA